MTSRHLGISPSGECDGQCVSAGRHLAPWKAPCEVEAEGTTLENKPQESSADAGTSAAFLGGLFADTDQSPRAAGRQSANTIKNARNTI